MEEWKDVRGLEGYYQVSNHGRVRSLDREVVNNRNGGMRFIKGRSMKLTESKGRGDGKQYLVVNLRKKGWSKVHLVHRLVAEHFIPNPQNLPTVNHINGDKHDNHFENLEWCSYLDNNIHALENNLRKPKSNPIAQYAASGELINTYKSISEASRATGLDRSSISHAVNGRIDLYGGFIWKRIKNTPHR